MKSLKNERVREGQKLFPAPAKIKNAKLQLRNAWHFWEMPSPNINAPN